MDTKFQGDESAQSLNDIIEGLEKDSFIGRQREIEIFKHYITLTDQYVKVLHIYGPGGIGKSFLLGEFTRLAEEKGMLLLKMDSGDYSHTPAGFLEQLLALLSTKVNNLEINFDIPKHELHQYCLKILSDISEDLQIIITIDTYSSMDGLDRWFRQAFIRYLHPNIFIILAGRKALKGEWEQSPAWRKVTKQIKLENFNLEQTRSFLEYAGIEEEQVVQILWRFTDGHPLALTLATLTNEEIDLSNPEYLAAETPYILSKLTKIWLEEVIDGELLRIVELAALFNTFDQSSLSAILNQEVSLEKFNELISFSFVKRVIDGWTVHDLIRDAVTIELQHRNPEYFKVLTDRLITHYYKKTIATQSAYYISQFFYHVGDEAIQSTFFQDKIDTTMYLEPVEEYNFRDVITFFNNKKENITESNVQFFDRTTDNSILFYVSQQHNLIESELIDETYIEKIGYDCAKLLKNKLGEILGISIVVPINQVTLKHLLNEPVSKTYFSHLSEDELAYYNVPEDEKAGYFIRMLDYKDQADTKARSFLLYSLFSLLLSGGKIIVSTPLTFFQDMLDRFGFTVVPGAEHYDYGEDSPSPTYLLDVSGSNLANYLQHFMESVSQNNKINFIAETFSFTDREKEIVILILENKANATIAKQLFIAEVTVKKHITRILKKADVANRAQLIKRIMELI